MPLPFGIFVVVVLIAVSISAFAAWYGAPWAPTPNAAIEAGFAAADVGPQDLVIDIGAGDGRVLMAAARRGARAVGYELAPLIWVAGMLRTLPYRRRVQCRFADGFRADLSSATVVFVFLIPRTVGRFVAHLRRQRFTHPVRVLSYAFPLPLAVVPEVVRVPRCASLYLYRLS